MANNNRDYSTRRISSKLLAEFADAIEGLEWGSLEIYVSNSEVTQITRRQIKKTDSSAKKPLTRRLKLD